jgi:hypothetical protein
LVGIGDEVDHDVGLAREQREIRLAAGQQRQDAGLVGAVLEEEFDRRVADEGRKQRQRPKRRRRFGRWPAQDRMYLRGVGVGRLRRGLLA